VSRPVRWVPREHGAWAILAVPLLLGIAAAGAVAAHALLAVAAVSAYLFSVPFIDWLRTRRLELLRPAAVFGALLAASGIPLLAQRQDLAAVAAGVGGLGLATAALTVTGHPKSVLVSLLEVAQAIALVPAAAIVAGTLYEPATWRATLAAGSYLAGSVLVVRSMIRARGDARYLAASIAFHAAGLVAAVALLPWPYVVISAGLLGRAVALPVLAARLAPGPRRLRPIHIGIVEIVASTALVALAIVVGF
jgi:hypothetical protein